MANNEVSRRQFLTASALALTGLSTVDFPAMANPTYKNEKIRLGLIGTGARGVGLATLIREMPAVELIACCDILPEHLKDGMNLAAKGAKSYTDYRKLLENKDIDAV